MTRILVAKTTLMEEQVQIKGNRPFSLTDDLLKSRNHTYINLTPLNPTLLYSKTGDYRGIHYFSYFCSKT